MNNFLIPVIGFDQPVLTDGKGSYVFDGEKKYLDLNSGQFCTVLGHNNPEFNQLVHKQIDHLAHTATGMLSDIVLECAEKLYQISGDMKAYSILLSTGAEAIEFCLRNAKALKNKNGIVCFDKGYHGLTLGTQSVTFGGKYAKPLVSSIYPFPAPDTFADEQAISAAVKDFENLIQQNVQDIAAVLFEPVVSVGGMIFPPKEFFKQVRTLCDRYGVLLVLDECQTGFGRLGEWFAYQQLGIVPDMVALAKGIGNGYPVSAVLVAEKHIPQGKLMPVTHYSSHQNDPFSAAVVLGGIKYIEEHDILARVKETGEAFLQDLARLCAECKYVVNARGCGFMLGADLHCPGVSNYRTVYQDLHRLMLQKGVIIQATNGGQTLRFLPDYLMEEAVFAGALDALKLSLNELDWGKYGGQ